MEPLIANAASEDLKTKKFLDLLNITHTVGTICGKLVTKEHKVAVFNYK